MAWRAAYHDAGLQAFIHITAKLSFDGVEGVEMSKFFCHREVDLQRQPPSVPKHAFRTARRGLPDNREGGAPRLAWRILEGEY